MVTDYLEAVLLWSEGGPSPRAAQYLERYGLTILPMAAGLLISGDRRQFEEAFQSDLSQIQTPFALPVPPELQTVVASIVIPGERRIHDTTRL